jgi:hypothetical protein
MIYFSQIQTIDGKITYLNQQSDRRFLPQNSDKHFFEKNQEKEVVFEPEAVSVISSVLNSI